MERSHVLGMVCGYYLSRFDVAAYQRLGHGSQRATHDALAAALDVQSASIKNWRDEFDPVHDNDRQGWHRREMAPSRKRAISWLSSSWLRGTERSALSLRPSVVYWTWQAAQPSPR